MRVKSKLNKSQTPQNSSYVHKYWDALHSVIRMAPKRMKKGNIDLFLERKSISLMRKKIEHLVCYDMLKQVHRKTWNRWFSRNKIWKYCLIHWIKVHCRVEIYENYLICDAFVKLFDTFLQNWVVLLLWLTSIVITFTHEFRWYINSSSPKCLPLYWL